MSKVLCLAALFLSSLALSAQTGQEQDSISQSPVQTSSQNPDQSTVLGHEDDGSDQATPNQRRAGPSTDNRNPDYSQSQQDGRTNGNGPASIRGSSGANPRIGNMQNSGDLNNGRGQAETGPSPIRRPRTFDPKLQSEFQRSVTLFTGENLPVFGRDLFLNAPSTFAPVDRVPVTANYVIGPGDEILIRAWGQIDIDFRATVDRAGAIFVPKVGSLHVAGLRYEQLDGYMRAAIGRVFQNFDLNVNLGQLRSIQVFLVGRAERPGSYTISSLSTLVNALFYSGGPSSTGSMRRIQVKRAGAIVTEFDMYDLLLNGDKSRDVSLLPGDVIYIPAVGPQAAISGSVNTPAIYELKPQSTVSDLVNFSGGLTGQASLQDARLQRVHDHSVRRIQVIQLTPAGLGTSLQDGDVLQVRGLDARFDNAVVLRGNVANPGRFEWHQGMRIHDLIPSREALITSGYYLSQNSMARPAIRKSREDQQYQRDGQQYGTQQQSGRDQLQRDQMQSRYSADPEQDTANERTELKRDVPEINWDYAVVQRLNPDDLSPRLVAFELGNAIKEPASAQDIELLAGDVVTIFSQQDMAVPLEKRTKYVYLEGEFLRAGTYRVEPGERLRSVIERAGGFTEKAYLFGAEFQRESARISQQERYDAALRDFQSSVEREALKPSTSSPQEALDLKENLERQRQSIDRLQRFRPTGRLIIALKPESHSVEEVPDLELEDGDHFVVPSRPGFVNVVGAVRNQSSFLYSENRSAGQYLRNAGGAVPTADKNRTFVIRANGVVIANHGFGGNTNALRMYPGDTVVVPESVNRTTFTKGFKDWTQILSQFALGAAAIRILQ